METFTVVLPIYNFPMGLIITPIDNLCRRFKVETIIAGYDQMIIKYLPNHTWIAENVTNKHFTKENIQQLDVLIEKEKKERFYSNTFADLCGCN